MFTCDVIPAGSEDTSRAVFPYFAVSASKYGKMLNLSKKQQVLSLQFSQLILDLKQ